MLLAVKTVKSDWCVSIRLLLVKKSVGLLLVKCLFFVSYVDCKQSLSGQSRGCAHSAARLERGGINEKRLSPSSPPLVCSSFFALGYFARPLDYPERDCLQSISYVVVVNKSFVWCR